LTGNLLDYGPFDYATVLQIDDLLILLCSSGHGKANEGYQCQDEKSFHFVVYKPLATPIRDFFNKKKVWSCSFI